MFVYICFLLRNRGISQPTSAPVLSNLECTSYSNENGFTTYGCSFSTAATCAPGDSAAVECSESLQSHTCVHAHKDTHLHTWSHRHMHARVRCLNSQLLCTIQCNLCIYAMLITLSSNCKYDNLFHRSD